MALPKFPIEYSIDIEECTHTHRSVGIDWLAITINRNVHEVCRSRIVYAIKDITYDITLAVDVSDRKIPAVAVSYLADFFCDSCNRINQARAIRGFTVDLIFPARCFFVVGNTSNLKTTLPIVLSLLTSSHICLINACFTLLNSIMLILPFTFYLLKASPK